MNYKTIQVLIVIVILFIGPIEKQVRAENNDCYVVTDVSKPLSRQFKWKDTTYVIRDTFNLEGKSLRVPKGAVLLFEGGFLINGKIKGNGTFIHAGAKQIFDYSISIKGNWRGTKFLPEWFGAVGDGIANDTEAFQRTIDNAGVIMMQGKYKVTHLTINKTASFAGGELVAFLDEYGNTRNVFTAQGDCKLSFKDVSFNGSGKTIATNGLLEPMISIQDVKAIRFDRCSFHHHSQNSGLKDDEEWQKRRCYLVSILGADDVLFNACDFHHNLTEQIAVGSNTSIKRRKPNTHLVIKNCLSHNNERSLALFLLFELKSALIDSCSFSNNGRTFLNLFTPNVLIKNSEFKNTSSRAITSESEGNYYSIDNIVIKSNTIINAREGAISVGSNNVKIINNTIINDLDDINNDYIIRVGGVITGENTISKECEVALPYYNNSFQANNTKGNIVIDNNTIKGSARKSVIAIRPTENVSAENETTQLGIIKDVTISHNKIYNTNDSHIIYFPNGDYNNITVSENMFDMHGSNPIVHMSPSFAPSIKISIVKNFMFAGNEITYPSNQKVDYLIEMGNGEVSGFKSPSNGIHVNNLKSITNF